MNNTKNIIRENNLTLSRRIMLLHIWYLLCLDFQNTVLSQTFYNAVYWNVKPYYFIDPKTGNVTGILPDLVKRANFYCGDGTTNYHINFTLPMEESNDLNSLFHSKVEYGTGKLADLSKENTIWFPYFKFIEGHDLETFHERNAIHLELNSIESVVVVRKSQYILMEYKFMIGLYNCRVLFAFIFLLSIAVSIATWLLERNVNDEIATSLIKGVADSYWMNTVTLVTVGYGDVCPKSPITKVIMVVWMFLGLFYAALLTATLLGSMSSDNVESLKTDKRVAIVDNSFEKNYIENNYNPNIIPTRTNEDAVEMVRAGKADSAVLNSWTAAWYQDVIIQHDYHNELSFVGEIMVDIPLMIVFSTPEGNPNQRLWECMEVRWDEIVKYSFNKFRRKVKVKSTKLLDLKEAVHFIPYQVIVILTLFAILIALVVYYMEKLKLRKPGRAINMAREESGFEKEESKTKQIPLSILW